MRCLRKDDSQSCRRTKATVRPKAPRGFGPLGPRRDPCVLRAEAQNVSGGSNLRAALAPRRVPGHWGPGGFSSFRRLAARKRGSRLGGRFTGPARLPHLISGFGFLVAQVQPWVRRSRRRPSGRQTRPLAIPLPPVSESVSPRSPASEARRRGRSIATRVGVHTNAPRGRVGNRWR